MAIVFDEVHVDIISPRNAVLSWALEPTNDPLGNYRFDVLRSQDPESEFVPKVTGLRNQFYWVDSSPDELSKWVHAYYVVKAYRVDSSGSLVPGTEVESAPIAAEVVPSALGLYKIYAKQLVYRQTGIGRETLVFRRRGSGQRCTGCWDPIEQTVTRHSCPLCFGTGFLQGYYSPIKVLVKYKPSPAANTLDTQLKEFNYTEARMANYPPVKPRDIFYEIGTGRWWLVNTVRVTEDKRVLVSQFLEIRQLDAQNKEQDLQLPTLTDDETIEAMWLVEAK